MSVASIYIGSVPIIAGTTATYPAVSGSTSLLLQCSDGNVYPVTLINDGGLVGLSVGQTPASGSSGFVNIGTVSAFSTGSTYNVTSSWAINALTASTMTLTSPYVTLTTSSNNAITCSFADVNESVTFISSALYTFTNAALPTAAGQVSDLFLHISQSSTSTSSLSFPATWINLGAGWPTQITSSKMAVVWLRAMNTATVMGTYNVQL